MKTKVYRKRAIPEEQNTK